MQIGYGLYFQNPHFQRSDREVWQNEVRLAELAEPLGFHSIWSLEHHFTDYSMEPDALQFLTYMAAKTQRILLGSMVVVLPWHHPLRVAEQVSLLDHLSGGRAILGIGRGLARIEFEGFGIPMDQTRQRFIESAELILHGLERGYCEYEGEFIKQPRREIHPAPFKSFKGRVYAGTGSPESMEIVAKLGIGLLINPQKTWENHLEELTTYRAAFRKWQGAEAPPPIVTHHVVCHQDGARAEELARQYLGVYHDSVLRHYEIGAEAFGEAKGYEYYKRMGAALKRHGSQSAAEFFTNLQVFGTPAQCLERIRDVQAKLGNQIAILIFSYGGLPYEEVERSLRLFAAEAVPQLQQSRVPA